MKVKNILICFILLFSIHKFRSQSYFKIPTDTNHFWRQFSICFETNNINRFDYQLGWSKDTLIGIKTYNKYCTFGRSYGYQYCKSFIQNGFLRQDVTNKKVFILDGNFQERPLYDFSKSVGDTLLHYNKSLNANVTLTITNIDTAYLYDGTKHKAFWVSKNNCFIEGIGSIFGGLYGNDQLFETPDNVSEQLMCFGVIQPFFETLEGITQNFYTCAFVSETVGVKEYQNLEKYKIEVYPNPVLRSLTIKYTEYGTMNIQLINSLAQEVYSLNNIKSKEEIDLSFLSSGIYFLKLQNNSKQKVFKIIKE